jgi:hypothetical protein
MKGLNWRPDMDAAEYHKHPPEFTQFLHGVGGSYTGPVYDDSPVHYIVSRLARMLPSALDRVFMWVAVGEGRVTAQLERGLYALCRWYWAACPLRSWLHARYHDWWFNPPFARMTPVRVAFFHFIQQPYDPVRGFSLGMPPGWKWTVFVFGLLRVHYWRNRCGYSAHHVCESCAELLGLCRTLRSISRHVRDCVDLVLRGTRNRYLDANARLSGFEPVFEMYPCMVVVHRSFVHGSLYHPVELSWSYLQQINSNLCMY